MGETLPEEIAVGKGARVVIGSKAAMSSTDDPERPKGRVIDGKYHVIRLLPGKGDVMRALAERPGIGRTVEIRMLSPRTEAGSEPDRLLEREVRALGAASSPHLQSVIDAGMDGRQRYFVFEAAEGPTVSELVADGPLAVERAARLVLQALAGLRALHGAGIVARALSPESFVVVRPGDGEMLKIRGLERVEFLDAEPSGLPVPFSPYVAPEIRRGDDGRDVRVDVYAIGMLFRHLVTGRTSAGPIEDELASRAIARATSDDPDDRFPSADVCLQAIQVCVPDDALMPSRGRLPEDPLVRDIHYLTLRRRTLHGRVEMNEPGATVEHPFVLLVIEAIYRRIGKGGWSKIADGVPSVETLLPSSGHAERYAVEGVPILLVEQLLDAADHVGGKDDLGILPELAESMIERGAQRIFPDLPPNLSCDGVIDGFPFLWGRVRRSGRAAVQLREERSAKVVICEQCGASLEVSGLFAALLRAMLRQVGGVQGDVSVLSAAALGDDADRFVARW